MIREFWAFSDLDFAINVNSTFFVTILTKRVFVLYVLIGKLDITAYPDPTNIEVSAFIVNYVLLTTITDHVPIKKFISFLDTDVICIWLLFYNPWGIGDVIKVGFYIDTFTVIGGLYIPKLGSAGRFILFLIYADNSNYISNLNRSMTETLYILDLWVDANELFN